MDDSNQTTRSPASSARPYRRGLHAVALLATAFTWPLLFVGGLVTTYRVGMAVPDWPKTFGINMFLYNFGNATWGVFIEHGHRLYGSAVGLGCIILAAWFTGSEGRRAWRPVLAALPIGAALGAVWIGATGIDSFLAVIVVLAGLALALAFWFAMINRKAMPALGWLALAAVIGQGALGGYRVRLNSTDLAAVHGCVGQAFFALMTTLCVITGRRWVESRSGSGSGHPVGRTTRWLAALTALLIYGQIVAGAWLRHRSLGLLIHASLAVVVLGVVAITSTLVLRRRTDWPELVPSARALAALLILQLGLGVASWWVLRPFDGIARPVTPSQAIVRTAHQANGALVLAASVVLALRAFRPVGPAPSTNRPVFDLDHRDLEAVTS